MKLYAIRDKMIDYFQPPFVANGDNDVLASVAIVVNTQEKTNAINQAPHHYEIYQLAEINSETGEVTACKIFIADASSLVRGGIRNTAHGNAEGDQPTPEPARAGQRHPSRAPGNGAA